MVHSLPLVKHQILCVQTHVCCVYVLDLCCTCFRVYTYVCGFVPMCLHHLCTFAPAACACVCANCIQPPLPHTTTTSTCYSPLPPHATTTTTYATTATNTCNCHHHVQQPLPHIQPPLPLHATATTTCNNHYTTYNYHYHKQPPPPNVQLLPPYALAKEPLPLVHTLD